MLYHKLQAIEKNVRDGNIGDGLAIRNHITMPDLETGHAFDFYEVGNGEKHYQKEVTDKTAIVLHFTVGTLSGDLRQLTKDSGVSTAFVVARDGSLYRLFDPVYWAWHLGASAVGGNSIQSRRTIAIEISNLGPLILKGDQLHTVYSKPERPQVYCTVFEISAYQKLETPWRGYQYFATFTDAQYRSLHFLLRYLTQIFMIPRVFLPAGMRYDTVNVAATFRGILTHVNFRKDGKWDIGPAFDWKGLMLNVCGG